MNIFKSKETLMAFTISLFVLVILVFVDLHNTNIGFLQLRSIDEYTFHGSLLSMYHGITDPKFSRLFSYGFYQYGFIYFFINLAAIIPALLLKWTSLSVFLPRLIVSLFATGGLVLVYKVSRRFISAQASLLMMLIFVTMPAFWFNATWFHPDWAMTFFLLASIPFFTKDAWKFGKEFYLGVLLFSCAVAFKYQAITMLPLVFGYIFYDNLKKFSFSGLLVRLKIFFLSCGIVLGVFFISNPFIVHPVGWKLFTAAFIGNLQSNATNHGAMEVVSLADKMNHAVSDYYMIPVLALGLAILAFFLLYRFFKDRERSIFPVVAFNFLVNILYLFFFVNKAWQIYYLPVIVSGLLMLPYFLKKMSVQKQVIILSFVIALQLISQGSHTPRFMTLSRDYGVSDANDYSSKHNEELNNFIINALKDKVSDTESVLLTPYTPFEYEKAGISFEQVKIIYGPLNANAFDREAYIDAQKKYWGDMKTREEIAPYFKEIKFIILRKNIPFIDTKKIKTVGNKQAYDDAVKVVQNLNNGTLGYEIFAENDLVVIYGLKK